MHIKIILQLEFKDTFFHLSDSKPDNLEYIKFSDSYIIIRNGFKEFIEALNTEFNFAVWSIYPKDVLDIIVTYISSIGISFLYQRFDAAYYLEITNLSDKKRD